MRKGGDTKGGKGEKVKKRDQGGREEREREVQKDGMTSSVMEGEWDKGRTQSWWKRKWTTGGKG